MITVAGIFSQIDLEERKYRHEVNVLAGATILSLPESLCLYLACYFIEANDHTNDQEHLISAFKPYLRHAIELCEESQPFNSSTCDTLMDKMHTVSEKSKAILQENLQEIKGILESIQIEHATGCASNYTVEAQHPPVLSNDFTRLDDIEMETREVVVNGVHGEKTITLRVPSNPAYFQQFIAYARQKQQEQEEESTAITPG